MGGNMRLKEMKKIKYEVEIGEIKIDEKKELELYK